jgi:hypothetical protein
MRLRWLSSNGSRRLWRRRRIVVVVAGRCFANAKGRDGYSGSSQSVDGALVEVVGVGSES